MPVKTFGKIVTLCTLLVLTHVGQARADLTVVGEFDPQQGLFPESVARDANGDLILSMAPQHTLWKFVTDGSETLVPLATLPVPEGASAIGVKIGADQEIYACTAALDPTLDAAHVWRVTPSGATSLHASLNPYGFPNDIAIDDDGNLFVTDSVLGAVYQISPAGSVSTWLDDAQLSGDPSGPVVGLPFGANGIALDRRDRHLYITNTDRGEVYRVRIRHDGSAGRLVVFASDPVLVGADGIALDAVGRLYVAVNAQNSVARISRRGHVSIVAQGGVLDGPSSVAFSSDGPRRSELYVTSFALGTLLGGGVPKPSLETLPVRFGGLPLP